MKIEALCAYCLAATNENHSMPLLYQEQGDMQWKELQHRGVRAVYDGHLHGVRFKLPQEADVLPIEAVTIHHGTAVCWLHLGMLWRQPNPYPPRPAGYPASMPWPR